MCEIVWWVLGARVCVSHDCRLHVLQGNGICGDLRCGFEKMWCAHIFIQVSVNIKLYMIMFDLIVLIWLNLPLIRYSGTHGMDTNLKFSSVFTHWMSAMKTDLSQENQFKNYKLPQTTHLFELCEYTLDETVVYCGATCMLLYIHNLGNLSYMHVIGRRNLEKSEDTHADTGTTCIISTVTWA